MIIEIVGRPRTGKTALNTLFLLREQVYCGQFLRERSAQLITEFNKLREAGEKQLSIPDK